MDIEVPAAKILRIPRSFPKSPRLLGNCFSSEKAGCPPGFQHQS